MNTLNLPLALYTIVLRRFIDKMRSPQGGEVLRSTSWFLNLGLLKPSLNVYLFFVALFFIVRHMRQGTIVALANKCSNGAVSIKDKCFRNRCAINRRSWVLNKLLSNRDDKQKGLSYVATLAPHDPPVQQCSNVACLNVPSNNNAASNRRCPIHNQCVNSRNVPVFSNKSDHFYGSNPYFTPHGPIINKMPVNKVTDNQPRVVVDTLYCSKNTNQNRNLKAKVNCEKYIAENQISRHADQSYIVDAYGRYDDEKRFRRNVYDSLEAEPINETSDYINVSDNTEDYCPKMKITVAKRKPAPRIRNCLTLRSRKINKNELNCDNKIVRKTRSGRVYGYHNGTSRYKKRNL